MEDNLIIELFWSRSEQAISETSKKYGSFLLGIARNILSSHEDAEECVNDTYLNTWNAIPPSRPNAFRCWLGRITRNLSIDRYHYLHTQKRGGGETAMILSELEYCIPSDETVERHLEEAQLAGLISSFLKEQTKESRIYFVRRYWYGDTLAQIAARYGVTQSKVKSSLFRTRRALQAFLEKEGVFL